MALHIFNEPLPSARSIDPDTAAGKFLEGVSVRMASADGEEFSFLYEKAPYHGKDAFRILVKDSHGANIGHIDVTADVVGEMGVYGTFTKPKGLERYNYSEGLWVHPLYRKRGIGRALLVFAMASARAKARAKKKDIKDIFILGCSVEMGGGKIFAPDELGFFKNILRQGKYTKHLDDGPLPQITIADGPGAAAVSRGSLKWKWAIRVFTVPAVIAAAGIGLALELPSHPWRAAAISMA